MVFGYMEGASYNTTAFINAYRTTQSQSLELSSNGMCVFLQHVARRHRWWWLWHDSSRHCIRVPPTTSTAPPRPLLHPTHYGFISTILTIGRRNPLQINTIANSESIGYCLFHSQRHVYCWEGSSLRLLLTVTKYRCWSGSCLSGMVDLVVV